MPEGMSEQSPVPAFEHISELLLELDGFLKRQKEIIAGNNLNELISLNRNMEDWQKRMAVLAGKSFVLSAGEKEQLMTCLESLVALQKENLEQLEKEKRNKLIRILSLGAAVQALDSYHRPRTSSFLNRTV